MTLLLIIVSTLIISSISVISSLFLACKPKLLSKLVYYLVGLSTGTLLGGAFFHLIPESLETQSFENVSIFLLLSFAGFYLIERILHWHHCHDDKCSERDLGYMNLIGDGIHNFIDGLIIAAAFLVDIKLGIVSSFALIFHEIPQELSDFGVLIYSGFTRKKAIIYNLLAAMTSVLGGIIGYIFFDKLPSVISVLLPLAAGSFIYISTSDLIPELKRENNKARSLLSFILFLLGILMMYLFSKNL